MLNLDTLRTMGRLLATTAREKVAHEETTANEVIDLMELLEPWKEGKHTAGKVVVYNDYPYKVVQAHDSTGNPTWNPKDAPSLFSPFHATDRMHALPYVAPTGAHDTYNAGEWMIYTDGFAYKCTRDGATWGPDVDPAAWEVSTDV